MSMTLIIFAVQFPPDSRGACQLSSLSSSFLKDFIYLFFREGKGGRKKGRETSMCGCLSRVPNPGMCPDWQSNQQHLVHSPVLNPLSHTSQGSATSKSVCPKLHNIVPLPFFMFHSLMEGTPFLFTKADILSL